MEGIHAFLKRYLDFTPPAKVAARAAAKAINEYFGTDLTEDAITVRGGKAYVAADAALKSEIAMRKKELLKNITAALGNGAVSDIA